MSLRFIPAVHRVTHAIAVMLDGRPDLDVSQGEAHILARLAESDAVTPSELNRAFGHKLSTLTSIFDRLVDRGLVTRSVGTEDRRTFEVRLTAAGSRLADRVVRALQDFESTLLSAVPDGKRTAFLQALASIDAGALQHARSATDARPPARSKTVRTRRAGR